MTNLNAPHISIQEKIELIQNHQCFSSLSSSEIQELALLANEKYFHPGDIIVHEDDTINAIYLIESGSIEVSRKIKDTLIPIATLEKGEAIGLSNTGFFSDTGFRTATLKAINSISLIEWTIDDFQSFLNKNPMLSSCMKSNAALIIRLHFIKQVTPFIYLPNKQLSELAKSIEEIDVDKDTIIFSEGDPGDSCFLIHSGEVSISTKNNDGTVRILNILEEKMLFGEIATLSSMPRNATATMTKAGKLFIIKKSKLQHIIEHCKRTADTLFLLAIERTRPLKANHISSYERITDDGETVFILKNDDKKTYLQLSTIGMFIWNLLDGKHTIEDITIAILNEFNLFLPNEVTDTIFNLAYSYFIQSPSLFFLLKNDSPQSKQKIGIANHFKKILFISYNIKEINAMITKSYHAFFYLLFTPIFATLLLILSIIGTLSFTLLLPTTLSLIPHVSHPMILLVSLYLINMLLAICHEAGHAYMTKSFGYDVHRAGIIFYWLGLFAFTDTSDMWLSTPNKRIAVSLAGPYADIIIASIMSLIAWFFSPNTAAVFLWLASMLLYISAFKNLNPIHDGDGSNILNDYFQDSHLRTKAFQWIVDSHSIHEFLTLFQKTKRPLLMVWISILIFFFIALCFSMLLGYYLSVALPATLFGISSSYVALLLPLYIIFTFGLSIRQSIKQLQL